MTTFRCQATGTFAAGDIWQCGVHLQSDTGTIADAVDAAAAWWDGLFSGDGDTVEGYLSLMSPGTVYSEIVVTEIDEETDQNLGQAVAARGAGGTSESTTMPPTQVSIVVSLRTAVATRAGRGRFYLPTPSSGALSEDGTVDPDALVVVEGAAEYAWTQLAGVDPAFSLVIRHRALHTSTPVTAASLDTVFDIQRRRSNKIVGTRFPISSPL